jgi:hypothetical protein
MGRKRKIDLTALDDYAEQFREEVLELIDARDAWNDVRKNAERVREVMNNGGDASLDLFQLGSSADMAAYLFERIKNLCDLAEKRLCQ